MRQAPLLLVSLGLFFSFLFFLTSLRGDTLPDRLQIIPRPLWQRIPERPGGGLIASNVDGIIQRVLSNVDARRRKNSRDRTQHVCETAKYARK